MSLKQRLRTAVDRGARWCGILGRKERASATALTVLTYHRVLPAKRAAVYPFASLAMPLDAFREQMGWLAANCEVLPLAQALEQHRLGGRPPRPLVSVTFDDGYADAAAFVAPVLEELGVRGTFFVTTGFVGSRGLLWFDRAVLLFAAVSESARREAVLATLGSAADPYLPQRGAAPSGWTSLLKSCRTSQRQVILDALEQIAGGPPPVDGFAALSVPELVELKRNDHEIGSHTVSHPLLSKLHANGVRDEIESARTALSDWLGGDVAGFCYPNGDFDRRVVDAVGRAGHTYACTTRVGTHRAGDDPFTIERVDVVPDRTLNGARRFDETAFRRELCGLYRRQRRSARGAERP